MKEIDEKAIHAIENGSDELYICGACGEWTSEEDDCCGVGPKHDVDLDMER